MSFKTTSQALTQMYLDLGLSLPTAYDGVDFDPPADTDWARLTIIPAVNDAVTNGKGGEDEESGICQIDLFAPVGNGTEKFWDWADTIQNQIIVGKGYTYNTQVVNIDSVVRRNIVSEGGWQQMTVEVNYYSRFTRPIF